MTFDPWLHDKCEDKWACSSPSPHPILPSSLRKKWWQHLGQTAARISFLSLRRRAKTLSERRFPMKGWLLQTPRTPDKRRANTELFSRLLDRIRKKKGGTSHWSAAAAESSRSFWRGVFPTLSVSQRTSDATCKYPAKLVEIVLCVGQLRTLRTYEWRQPVAWFHGLKTETQLRLKVHGTITLS